MNKRLIMDQRGVLGCGGWIIVIWVIIMLVFYWMIMLNQRLFYVPSEEKVMTSMAAARRCLEKLGAFEENKYVQQVILNEMEINSALEAEFANGKHDPLLDVRVSVQPEFFTLKVNLILLDLLLPDIIEEYWNKFYKMTTIGNDKNIIEVTRQEAFVKVDGNIRITEEGLLEVSPQEVHIGTQYIPNFLVGMIYKLKPDLFAVNVSHLVKSVELEKGKLRLKKTPSETTET